MGGLPVESAASAPISAPVSPSKAPPAPLLPNRKTSSALDGLVTGSPKIRHAAANGKAHAPSAATKKKHSLTTSLSNMMTQLDVRMGTTPTQSVPEDDAMSFRSDDSGDSECFVVINQQAVAEDTVDSTLFAIHSKRASPVEVASEAAEDDQLRSLALSNAASSTAPPPLRVPSANQANREGVVSETILGMHTKCHITWCCGCRSRWQRFIWEDWRSPNSQLGAKLASKFDARPSTARSVPTFHGKSFR